MSYDKKELKTYFDITQGDAQDQLDEMAQSNIHVDFEGTVTLMISTAMTLGRMQGLSTAIASDATFKTTIRMMSDYLEAVAEIAANKPEVREETKSVIDPMQVMLQKMFEDTPEGEIN